MSQDYIYIGLELGIVYDKLRNIQDDLRFPGPQDKCREMLNLWLKSDTSATWEKLCKVLESRDLNVLARDIREMIHSM